MESRESKIKAVALVAVGLLLSMPIIGYETARAHKQGYDEGWKAHEQRVLEDVPADRLVFTHSCLHEEGGILIDTPYALFCGHAPNKSNSAPVDEELMETLREAHGR